MSKPQKMSLQQRQRACGAAPTNKRRAAARHPRPAAKPSSDAALWEKIPPLPPSQTPAKELSKALQRSGLMEEFFFPPEPPHPPHFPEEEEL